MKQYQNNTKTYSPYHSRFQLIARRFTSFQAIQWAMQCLLHADMLINARGSSRFGANCTDCHNTSSLQAIVISSCLPPHFFPGALNIFKISKRIGHYYTTITPWLPWLPWLPWHFKSLKYGNDPRLPTWFCTQVHEAVLKRNHTNRLKCVSANAAKDMVSSVKKPN